MKRTFLLALLCGWFAGVGSLAVARAAEENPPVAPAAAAPGSAPAAPASYAAAMRRIFNRAALLEFMTKSDRLIDEVDPAEGAPRPLQTDTDSGLHLEFGLLETELATLYTLSLSRKGEEFHYSDAVKLASLFADRAGLTHPIIVKEGEKPVFYCEWLIKPSDWKKFRKLMLSERAQNRKIIEPGDALALAIRRELAARAAPSRKR